MPTTLHVLRCETKVRERTTPTSDQVLQQASTAHEGDARERTTRGSKILVRRGFRRRGDCSVGPFNSLFRALTIIYIDQPFQMAFYLQN